MDFTAYDKATVAVMLEHLYLGRKIAGVGPTQLGPAQVLQLLQLSDQIKPPRVKLLHAFAEKVRSPEHSIRNRSVATASDDPEESQWGRRPP